MQWIGPGVGNRRAELCGGLLEQKDFSVKRSLLTIEIIQIYKLEYFPELLQTVHEKEKNAYAA